MIELHKKEFPMAYELAKACEVDIVYPLSIVEGWQSGRIFVDSLFNPTCALFFHACGFGYYGGKYDEYILGQIAQMIADPEGNNTKRLALQIGSSELEDEFFKNKPGIRRLEQCSFEFTGWKRISQHLPEGCRIVEVDREIYSQIKGNVKPDFSWDSKEHFLEKGSGFCIFDGDNFAAMAFSTCVSNEYVDIGIETAPDYRGKGLAKIVADRLVAKIIMDCKTPIWECNSTNEGSIRTAEAVGFKLKCLHPLFIKG